MPTRVAMIGVWSIEITRWLTHEIPAVPELLDSVVEPRDAPVRNFEMLMRLLEREVNAKVE